MKVYLDENFICHVHAADGLREAESDYFDGKCSSLIEAFRFIPQGQAWTREDGVVFNGESISIANPNYPIVETLEQYSYTVDFTISIDDVADLIELIYQNDLEIIG